MILTYLQQRVKTVGDDTNIGGGGGGSSASVVSSQVPQRRVSMSGTMSDDRSIGLGSVKVTTRAPPPPGTSKSLASVIETFDPETDSVAASLRSSRSQQEPPPSFQSSRGGTSVSENGNVNLEELASGRADTFLYDGGDGGMPTGEAYETTLNPDFGKVPQKKVPRYMQAKAKAPLGTMGR